MILNITKQFVVAITFCIILSCSASNNDAQLSQNALTDKPHNVKNAEQLEKYEKLIAPYVKQAKESLPQAKEKYLNGLDKGESFFFVTRIYDEVGRFEQIFVRVINWEDDKITGTIANDLETVKGFEYGQVIQFPEKDVLDWLIALPDGSEKGNFVGKFLDSLN